MRLQKTESQLKKSLKEASEAFLERIKERIKASTYREYQLKINNQILQNINPKITLQELEWENGGRSIVMEAVEAIADGKKHDLAKRCQDLLRQILNLSISKGLMRKGTNPADKLTGDDSPESSSKHHPSICWKEVPALLREIELNKPNAEVQAVVSTKLLLMTSLRVGSLTRL